jgi:hypothetical protein
MPPTAPLTAKCAYPAGTRILPPVLAFWLILSLSLNANASFTTRQALATHDISDDVKVAVATLLHVMRKGSRNESIAAFDPRGRHILQEKNFSYRGFRVIGMDFLDCERDSGHKGVTRVQGLFHFANRFDQATTVQFYVRYWIRKGRVVILRSQAQVVPNPQPRIEVFFVPAATAARMEAKDSASWAHLYRFASRNAAAGRVDAKKRPYTIFLFAKDRLLPDAALEMVVSPSPDDIRSGASLVRPVYRDYRGWRVAMAAGSFRLNDPDDLFYVHAVLRRGKEAPEPVATFTNLTE